MLASYLLSFTFFFNLFPFLFLIFLHVITGLVNALKLLQPIKDKYATITYADLFQLASATAIEVTFRIFLINLQKTIYSIIDFYLT